MFLQYSELRWTLGKEMIKSPCFQVAYGAVGNVAVGIV